MESFNHLLVEIYNRMTRGPIKACCILWGGGPLVSWYHIIYEYFYDIEWHIHFAPGGVALCAKHEAQLRQGFKTGTKLFMKWTPGLAPYHQFFLVKWQELKSNKFPSHMTWEKEIQTKPKQRKNKEKTKTKKRKNKDKRTNRN